MEKKTVWYVQYDEVDDLVNANFPQVKGEYECLAYEEYGNDEAHTFNVNAEKKASDYERKEFEEGKFHYKLHLLFDELARMGKLPFTKSELVLEVSY